jgi:pyruvate/2-oxoglutarate dehydrogenase complex dihydrolipoamide acyltransferase (E2) component
MEVEVFMPRLGDEMVEGAIVEWLKKEGDRVEKGDPLLLVETGKATLEVEAEVAGVVKKILVAEKTEHIPIGQVIAIIET